MNKKLCLAFIFLLALVPVFAQYDPPAGSGNLYDLYSPMFLGGGVTSIFGESPAADVLNPAVSGARQRFTLDFSYIGLLGLGAENGLGHVLNAGVTWPTRAGVLSGSGHFVSSPFDSLDLGTLGALNVSFSKDLFPNLLVGAGLGAVFGADWGLGLDVGILHLVGDLKGLKNFRWGAALRGLGKGYTPVEGRNSFPPAFTPAVGAGFSLMENEDFLWTLHSDVSLPSMQNLRLSLGTGFSYRDIVTLRAGTTLDVMEMVNGDGRSVPLSFGLSVGFDTSIRSRESEVHATASAAPLQNGIWGIGAGVNIPFGVVDRAPPRIEIAAGGIEYISPNLDGVQDDLNKPIRITDERYIKGFRFTVFDAQGQVVREISNKDERPENVTFRNVVDRLMYVKEGIGVPDSLRWDGRTDLGTVAPDGTYTWQVEAWDDNGNVGRGPVGTVVVDNTPPVVEVASEYLIFSPNGDGNKDTLLLQQKGSEEDLWQYSIRDAAGLEVVGYSFRDQGPESFDWNGKNNQGVLVPDGVYSYHITATDRAGNTGSARLDNIIVNTQATPIHLTIDPAVFSPNADGVKDSLRINLNVPVVSGIESWRLEVRDGRGTVRRSMSGGPAIQASVEYDGRDDSGQVLAEGTYQASLEVAYQNGNRPTAESPPFILDLTPPSAVVNADLTVFSPDGDGNKDSVTIFQETSDEPLWQGLVEDIDGRIVRSFSWRGRADNRLVWTGLGDDGALLPDGIYTYSLKATDRAGNEGISKKIRFELNTEKTEVFLSADLGTFSPNADGVKDRLRISPRLKVTSGVARWQLRVLNAEGRAVRTLSGQNRAPETWAWDGLDDGGRLLPDGEYRAELVLDYLKGDHHEVRTPAFLIDTTAPQADIVAEYALFSPDGDGQRDTVPIRQSGSAEGLWEGEIRNAAGAVVRSLYWKSKLEDFTWDGRDDNGNRLPDGLYSYTLASTDEAGNKASVSLTGLRIDTRPTPVFVTASAAGLSPNGDGRLDAIDLRLVVTEPGGIRAWRLDLVHAEQGVQKSFTGAAEVPATLRWDGSGKNGRAPEGSYRAVLTVDYLKGNRPEAATSAFLLDTTPPEVDLSLLPQPFSPDNDGVNDELTIGIRIRDASPIERWGFRIDDPTGVRFADFSGRGMPSEKIIWNGLSDTGELVQSAEEYPFTLEVTDSLGNTAIVRKDISVDVLVIREGDRLKVRITSIVFPANSPDLGLVTDPENQLRNNRTLKRLAEIFNKYRSYQILIEGHANSVFWYNQAQAAKEQEEQLLPLSRDRAEAVKAALVQLGLDQGRITTSGVGGAQPLVPFADEINRWKNRRVEFILIKKP